MINQKRQQCIEVLLVCCACAVFTSVLRLCGRM